MVGWSTPLQWAGRWSSIGIVTITTTIYTQYNHSTTRSWNMITTTVPPGDGISSLLLFCYWKELITTQIFYWNRCDHYQEPHNMCWNFLLNTLAELSVPEKDQLACNYLQQTGGKVRKVGILKSIKLSLPLADCPSVFLSPSGDLGIGLVWDNHPDHTTPPNCNFSVRQLKSSSKWTKLSIK